MQQSLVFLKRRLEEVRFNMANFFRKYSNTFSYMIIFGVFLFLMMGPLGAAAGIAIGIAVGQHEDMKKENK